jgi:hypothetical protein
MRPAAAISASTAVAASLIVAWLAHGSDPAIRAIASGSGGRFARAALGETAAVVVTRSAVTL